MLDQSLSLSLVVGTVDGWQIVYYFQNSLLFLFCDEYQ